MSFLLVLTEFSSWQGDWARGYHSSKFLDFPDISQLSCWETCEATRIYHVYNKRVARNFSGQGSFLGIRALRWAFIYKAGEKGPAGKECPIFSPGSS